LGDATSVLGRSTEETKEMSAFPIYARISPEQKTKNPVRIFSLAKNLLQKFSSGSKRSMRCHRDITGKVMGIQER
jgi:hypothetical protein